MKKIILFSMIATLVSCEQKKSTAETEMLQEVKPTEIPDVKRGQYLVEAMGCEDCHSPKKMGQHGPELIEELRFSGYPETRPSPTIDKANMAAGWVLMNADLTSAVGPWGQSFAANISSDATGIGNWTEEHFITAMRKGKSKGLENGRDILPPMPWPGIGKLNDEDLKSIFAFLQSTTPVKNIAPNNVPPGAN